MGCNGYCEFGIQDRLKLDVRASAEHNKLGQTTKMPLTRHFYEMDEVISAQQVCLRNNWTMKALFWTWELLASAETEAALNGVRLAWLRWGGGYYPSVMTQQPKTANEWIQFVMCADVAIGAAGSLNAERFLAEAAIEPTRQGITPAAADAKAVARRKERSAAFVAYLSPEENIDHDEAAEFWISLDSACRQGSRRDAFWLLQAAQPVLSADAIWSALRLSVRGDNHADLITIIDRLRATAGPHPVHQVLHQAAVLLIHCTPTSDRPKLLAPPTSITTLAPRFQRAWTEWSAVMGRRAARIYAIPKEAMHAATTRGSLAKRFTNINDVREPIYGLVDGCKWWQEAVAAAGILVERQANGDIEIEFLDDDVLEAFYDKHFPDDIPDEWSAEDQQKSHGVGVAETAAVAPAAVAVREELVEPHAWSTGILVRDAARYSNQSVNLLMSHLNLGTHIR